MAADIPSFGAGDGHPVEGAARSRKCEPNAAHQRALAQNQHKGPPNSRITSRPTEWCPDNSMNVRVTQAYWRGEYGELLYLLQKCRISGSCFPLLGQYISEIRLFGSATKRRRQGTELALRWCRN